MNNFSYNDSVKSVVPMWMEGRKVGEKITISYYSIPDIRQIEFIWTYYRTLNEEQKNSIDRFVMKTGRTYMRAIYISEYSNEKRIYKHLKFRIESIEKPGYYTVYEMLDTGYAETMLISIKDILICCTRDASFSAQMITFNIMGYYGIEEGLKEYSELKTEWKLIPFASNQSNCLEYGIFAYK